MNNNLIELILKTIGEELNDDRKLSEKRKKEYSKVFNENSDDLNNIYKSMSIKSVSDKLLKKYTDKLFDKNTNIQKYRNIIHIKIIDSIRENTKSVSIDDDNHLITFDSYIMKYIWMMNKGFLYGALYLNEEENINLFHELFLYFGSQKVFKYKHSTNKPITPEHQDLNTLMLLQKHTEIQEIFLISHEIAHMLIEKNDYKDIAPIISTDDYLLKNIGDTIISDEINEEILADEIAFNLTLNVYKDQGIEMLKLVYSSIFILIRYMLWLRIVYKESKDDNEFHIWFARNNFIRTKISSLYKEEEYNIIIEALELMEIRMEPAALIASETLKKIKKDFENNK
ncbi:MAG: hypothetical protein ACI81I_001044 [Arcobacteraceae bacterium]|jgi:hypothetical protein